MSDAIVQLANEASKSTTMQMRRALYNATQSRYNLITVLSKLRNYFKYLLSYTDCVANKRCRKIKISYLICSFCLLSLASACSSDEPSCSDKLVTDIVKTIAIKKTTRFTPDLAEIAEQKGNSTIMDIVTIEQHERTATCEATFRKETVTYPRFAYHVQRTDDGKLIVDSDGP